MWRLSLTEAIVRAGNETGGPDVHSCSRGWSS
jgi:hypothetical protein